MELRQETSPASNLRLKLRQEASSTLGLRISPSATTTAVFATWTYLGAMGRERDAHYQEEETKKAVEDRLPGLDASVELQWRHAMRVIGPRPVIPFQEQASP